MMSVHHPTPLVSSPLTPEGPDLARWGEQQLYWTERMRGRGLAWPRTASWFVNDPLRGEPHIHPDASEVYFVACGRLHVVVGSRELTLEAGDYCFIPADTYHDPRGTLGTDLGLFCVVAPNWRGRRIQTEDIPPEAREHEPALAKTDHPSPLPGDERLQSEVIELAPGTEQLEGVRPGAERVLYVLDGELEVTIDALHGAIGAHQYVHVPSNVRHRIAAAGGVPARVLSVWSREVGSDGAD
jgi:mannose-6-phosphate isomerase-like protein (cupin superfamily)